jgi:hypothetical protein
MMYVYGIGGIALAVCLGNLLSGVVAALLERAAEKKLQQTVG